MKKIIFFYCLILFLLVVYPLFISTGNIFVLDYAPTQSGQSCLWNFGGGESGIKYMGCFLGKILPDFVFFRLLILMIFGLLMTGGYYLLKETKNIYAILFCITLLCINPFFYGRIMDGQVNVLFASALFVWYIYFIKQAFQMRLMRYYGMMAVMTVFLAITSLYALYLAVFSYAAFFVVYFFGTHHKKTLLRGALVVGLIGMMLNVFWVTSTTNIASLSKQIASFDVTFTTTPGLYGSPLNAALLRGYWGETQHRFVTLDQFYKYPSVGIGLMAIVWLCVIYGVIHFWKKKTYRPEMISMVVLGIMGYILALGVDPGSPFHSGVQFLHDHLPFYSGFREPHKWSILLLIAYAYLGGHGVKELFSRMGTFRLRALIMIFLITIPLISTPLMLFGFMGQLQPKHFPEEYHAVHDFLKDTIPTKTCENRTNKKGQCYTFLYFPWYSYISLRWIGTTTLTGRVASFLTDPHDNLVGDNDIIGSTWSTSQRPESKIIERFIRRSGQRVNALEQLQEMYLFQKEVTRMGIQYIIVFRDHQYSGNYSSFLDACVDQGIFTLEEENKLLKVYRI